MDDILKDFGSTSPYHHNRVSLNAMAALHLARRRVGRVCWVHKPFFSSVSVITEAGPRPESDSRQFLGAWTGAKRHADQIQQQMDDLLGQHPCSDVRHLSNCRGFWYNYCETQ